MNGGTISRGLMVLLVAAMPATALVAEMRPHVIDAAYVEPEAPKLEPGQSAPAPIPQTCKLAITSVADTRPYQGYMGNFFDQPFHPPADRKAWVSSMAMGLNKRGFDVKITDGGAVPTGHVPVTLDLKQGWIDYPNGGFQALVKLRLVSQDPARPYDKVHRGTFWRTVFMATVGGRSNDAFHGAVANALDGIGDDLKAICG
jgi:hypothetical protein